MELSLLNRSTSYDEHNKLQVASIKLKKLPYEKIKLLEESRRASPSPELLRTLESLMLPDSQTQLFDDWDMKKSLLAFECITAFTNNKSNEYSKSYYEKVIRTALSMQAWRKKPSEHYDFLEQLNISVKTTADRNAMLRTIALCLTESTVDLKILEKFPSTIWRRELLLSSLFSKAESWSTTWILKIIKKIEDTMDLLTNENRFIEIENVLEYLVSNQENHKFKIDFLISTLNFISKEVNNEITKYITIMPIMIVNDNGEIQAITLEWKSYHKIISDYTKINVVNESVQDIELHDQREQLMKYLTDHSYGTIRYFFESLKEIEYNDIAKVMQLLSLLDLVAVSSTESQPFLYSLESYDFIVWRLKFIFFIAQIMISREFPVYKKDMVPEKLNAELINECNGMLSVPRNAECFRPLKATLSVSDTTYFDSDCRYNSILQKSMNLKKLLHYLHEKLVTFMVEISDENLPETIEIVKKLICNLDSESKIEKLANCLEILRDYSFNIYDEQILDIFSKSNCDDIEHNVHDFVIEVTFPLTYEKNRVELLRELADLDENLDFERVSEIMIRIDQLYIDYIDKWSASEILQWVFQRKKPAQLDEVLAIIKRAVFLTNHIKLRDIQIISLILIIDHQDGIRGKLGQIDTGEGKSVVIAMLAVYLALRDHKVDIITNTPALAIQQLREFTSFYKLFNISADHNIDNTKAYSSVIVYGTNISHQRDTLSDEFKKNDIRENRPFDIAIVDGVENMLIDGHNVVESNTKMPGMDQLEPLLGYIWDYVDNFETTSTPPNSNCKRHGRDCPCIDAKAAEIIENVMKDMKVHLRTDDREKNLDDEYEEIIIPNHLRQFVINVQLIRWIDGAINAKFGSHGKHYRECNATHLDGLHQFLEMKHKENLTPIFLVSNYLSNIGFFCRYSRIYGFTEILGNGHHVTLLREMYNVDSIIIPPFKERQHKELTTIIVQEECYWYAKIIDSCLSKIRNGRAILIITNDIEETDELVKRFQSADRSIKIKLYRTNDDSDVIKNPLNPREIIIATNLGVRGIDIKPAEILNVNGGIHVCLTHFSENSRVRVQNFGRTSRGGNRGTSQFVILEETNTTIDQLRYIYAEHEAALSAIEYSLMRKMKIRDDIFTRFCALLDSIKSSDGIKKKEAVEENFSIWLKMKEDILMDESIEDYIRAFDVFERTASQEEEIKNAYWYVLAGNQNFLKKAKKSLKWTEDDYKLAVEQYSRAIELDKDNIDCAYHNRAVAGLIFALKKQQHFEIDKIVQDFNKARQIMKKKKHYMEVVLRMTEYGTKLHEQWHNRMYLYDAYISEIDCLIGHDKQLLRDRIEGLMDMLDSGDRYIKKSRIKNDIKNIERMMEMKGEIININESTSRFKVKFLQSGDYLLNCHLCVYDEEIIELRRNGWLPPIEISENNDIQWLSIIIVLSLSLIQILSGAFILIMTNTDIIKILGESLIFDGSIDIYRAKTQCTGAQKFSWKKFFAWKFLTFFICLALFFFIDGLHRSKDTYFVRKYILKKEFID